MDWSILKKRRSCFVLNIKQHGVRGDTTVKCFRERKRLLVSHISYFKGLSQVRILHLVGKAGQVCHETDAVKERMKVLNTPP